MKTRFKNYGQEVGHFSGEMLVVCQRCSKCATATTRLEPGITKLKIVCRGCGYAREARLKWSYGRVPLNDRWFYRPLWLETSCCGETLWAFNLAHLNYIERYVRADLREEGFNHNRALANRLPRWMKLAKHRDEVLKGIARLKKRACEG